VKLDKPPVGVAHLEPHKTPVRAPVDERDRFYSFQFLPPTLVPGVQNYSPKRVASRACSEVGSMEIIRNVIRDIKPEYWVALGAAVSIL
jgi:hypothetical protein